MKSLLRTMIAALLIPALLLPLSACSKPTDPLGTGSAHAESPLPASENAALRYWEAWWEIGPDGFSALLDQIQRVDQTDAGDTEQDVDRGFESLISATEFQHCDFGKTFGDFVGDDPLRRSSLGHVMLLGVSFDLLLEDAKSKMRLGEIPNASRSLAAALRLVDHTAQQPLLLVLGSPAASVVEVADAVRESNTQFSDTNRAVIAQAVARFESEDPFRIAHSLHSELHAYADFLREKDPDRDTDLEPQALARIANAATDIMDSEDTGLEAIWIRLELSEENPTRQGMEPLIMKLRSVERQANESLDWLRKWSSQ